MEMINSILYISQLEWPLSIRAFEWFAIARSSFRVPCCRMCNDISYMY